MAELLKFVCEELDEISVMLQNLKQKSFMAQFDPTICSIVGKISSIGSKINEQLATKVEDQYACKVEDKQPKKKKKKKGKDNKFSRELR